MELKAEIFDKRIGRQTQKRKGDEKKRKDVRKRGYS